MDFTLINNNMSTLVQKQVLAVIPKITGMTSFVFSTFIVYTILIKRRNKKSTVYHRLLCGMSIADMSSSFWLSLSTWPIPKGANVLWSSGSTGTCTAQGFFTQLGITSPLYNASLSFYYLLVARYGYKEEQLQKIELFFHIIPLLWGFTTSISGIFLNLFHNATLWCWIASDSAITNRADMYRFVFFYGPLWIMVFAVTVNLILVFSYVRKITLSSEYHVQQQRLELSRYESNTNIVAVAESSRRRVVILQQQEQENQEKDSQDDAKQQQGQGHAHNNSDDEVTSTHNSHHGSFYKHSDDHDNDEESEEEVKKPEEEVIIRSTRTSLLPKGKLEQQPSQTSTTSHEDNHNTNTSNNNTTSDPKNNAIITRSSTTNPSSKKSGCEETTIIDESNTSTIPTTNNIVSNTTTTSTPASSVAAGRTTTSTSNNLASTSRGGRPSTRRTSQFFRRMSSTFMMMDPVNFMFGANSGGSSTSGSAIRETTPSAPLPADSSATSFARRRRQVANQCLRYAIAFYITWIPITVRTVFWIWSVSEQGESFWDHPKVLVFDPLVYVCFSHIEIFSKFRLYESSKLLMLRSHSRHTMLF